MTDRHSLIGYSLSFTSFLLDSRIGDKINKVVLFGSVARGDFDEESDIDLFIDTEVDEREVFKIIKLFEISKVNELWRQKGIKNEISIKVGDLNKWSLRRDVISSGFMLFGKYSEIPENAKYYLLIKMEMKGLSTARQMSVWRKLYGYRQKIGDKLYTGKGLLDRLSGKKLGKSIIIVPMDHRNEIIEFLNKNNINYTVNELWSDTF